MIFCSALGNFSREYRAVLSISGTTNELVETLADPQFPVPQPASARTMRDILSTCGRLLTLSPRLKSDPDLAERVTETCRKISAALLSTAPRNGRALAIGLLTSQHFDANGLEAAQSVAPYEPWPLNIRLQAVAGADALDKDTEALVAEDIRRAMLSPWGKKALADLYIAHPSFRPLVSHAAEQAAPFEQRQFLAILRREMQGRS